MEIIMNKKLDKIGLTIRSVTIIMCSERRDCLCQREAHYILWLHLRPA